jgi:hypothetical protein
VERLRINCHEQAKALAEINRLKREVIDQVISARRRGNTSDELTRDAQEQTDIRKDIVKNPVAAGVRDVHNDRLVALQKRQVEINSSVESFRRKETTV